MSSRPCSQDTRRSVVSFTSRHTPKRMPFLLSSGGGWCGSSGRRRHGGDSRVVGGCGLSERSGVGLERGYLGEFGGEVFRGYDRAGSDLGSKVLEGLGYGGVAGCLCLKQCSQCGVKLGASYDACTHSV